MLAILIRTGTSKETAVQLAERILVEFGGLQGLPRRTAEELAALNGLGPAKVGTLLATVELAVRLSSRQRTGPVTIGSPADVAGLVMEEMRDCLREHFRVVLLDVKNKVLGIEEISIGSLNASLVHPREVFRPAVLRASAGIILLHNHPSGDPTPSREDLEVTRRLCEVGKLVGIEVLDHVVIGDGRFFSFREKGLLPS